MEYSDQALFDQFEKATQYVREGKFSVTQEQQLQFYGLYKQSTVGPPRSEDAPGFFDFAGKMKFSAWSALGNMSKYDAMQKYLELLTSLSPRWEFGEGNAAVKKEKWICSSTLGFEADETPLNQKSICDIVAENDEINAMKLLQNDQQLVHFRDSEGRTPLHFACDRANMPLIASLIKLQANLNAQDGEGQTPLHYACACDHANVIEYLVNAGADVSVQDNDGQTALESCDESLREAFARTNLKL